jgi:hypothetical protein
LALRTSRKSPPLIPFLAQHLSERSLSLQRQRYLPRVSEAQPISHASAELWMQRLFPSKMTAFGIKQAGEEAFNAEQPTGVFLSPFFFNLRTLSNLSHDMFFIAPMSPPCYVP